MLIFPFPLQPWANIVCRKGARKEPEKFSSPVTWSLHGLQIAEGVKHFGINPLSNRFGRGNSKTDKYAKKNQTHAMDVVVLGRGQTFSHHSLPSRIPLQSRKGGERMELR